MYSYFKHVWGLFKKKDLIIISQRYKYSKYTRVIITMYLYSTVSANGLDNIIIDS